MSIQLSQLKVCFLAGTLGQGGAERQLFHFLQALRQSGAIPRVLCLGQHEFWEERITGLGVPVTWVGRAASRMGRLICILRELRADRPRIIQSHHFYTNAYAGLAGRLLRLATIGALRSNGQQEARDCGRLGGWLCLHTPRMLAANSQAALRYAAERRVSTTRFFPLPNVVDTAVFFPASERRAGPVRLLSVGRLIASKRFDRFLAAVALLRTRMNREVIGIIVGDGPLQEKLRTRAGDFHLPPAALELRGSLADPAPAYREADIFVLTSDLEGTPNVLLEAMASGLPVVATPVGDVPAMVRDGENGFLVNGNDAEGLSATLDRLVMNPHLRISVGERARAFVQASHSLERLPVLLATLYERALSRHPEHTAPTTWKSRLV